MSAKSEKILRDFAQSLTQPKGTSAYDTTAKVLRVENGTAWVHIPGGVDETPVKMTIDAKEGDEVQVRVSGGRAFIVGNATAPPTDDAEALVAKVKAEIADETAKEADTKATEAKDIAVEAGEAVAKVAQHFWTDEDGAHITEVTQEEYIDDPENAGSNTLLDSDGMYIRDGVTNKSSFGFMTRIGEEDKARIEITDESFRQITDNDVAAVDIQSSGATDVETVTKEINKFLFNLRETIPANSTRTFNTTIFTPEDAQEASPMVVKISRIMPCKGTTDDTYTQTITYDANDDTEITVINNQSLASRVTGTIQLRWVANSGRLQLRFTITNNNSTSWSTTTTISGTNYGRGVFLYFYKYQKTVYIPSIELNGEITFKRPADVFVITNHEYSYSNVSSGGNVSWNEDIEKDGYYPLGLMGFTSGRAGLGCEIARITDRVVGGCHLNCHFKNFTSSSISANKAQAHILWVKAE